MKRERKRERKGRRRRRKGKVWNSMDHYGLVWITMGLYGFVNFCMHSWILGIFLCLGFYYEKF